MVNPLKGEVEFEAEGKTWVFRLGTNEFASLMGAWGIPPQDGVTVFAVLEQHIKSPVILRTVFHHALHRHQPQTELDEVGDLLTILSDRAYDIVAQAFRRGIPVPNEPEDAAGARVGSEA